VRTLAADLEITKSAYDAVAELYADTFADAALADRPLDRAMLTAFAELVRTAGGGPVADVGCGPGHITALLAALGLDVFGVDLSPAMIAIARRRYPGPRFDTGTMTGLDRPTGSLGGIVASYSIIHTPPGQVPATLEEFHRMIAPGGHLLLAFLGGPDGAATAFDHRVTRAYRWPPDRLAGLLREAGFTVLARLVREPSATERFEQATLLASA
jgi:SAM-dependent methyltransferase